MMLTPSLKTEKDSNIAMLNNIEKFNAGFVLHMKYSKYLRLFRLFSILLP